MSKTKKAFSLGLNLIAPGLGQFALKWWIRGALQLLSSIILFLLAMWEVLYPIYGKVYDLLKDTPEAHNTSINLTHIFLIILLLILIWGWSFLEIILFYNPSEEENKK